MPVLVVERGNDKGRVVKIGRNDACLVGRDPSATLQVTDVLCSRSHFKIHQKDGKFVLEDLGSANGTFLNSKKVKAKRPLGVGDRIEIGSTLISFLSDDEKKNAGGLIGKVIAGHEIIERVGRGGMGTVFKARQVSLDRIVALKMLSREFIKDPDFVKQFQAEARAAAKLSHPNILAVYDVGEAEGMHYISMEFAGGGTLEDLVNKTSGKGRNPEPLGIPWEDAIPYFIGASKALLFAEKIGVVHRDIKPDNLMLNDHGEVKVGDLGLAMDPGSQSEGIFGTPYYIAPEQALGKHIDHRADMYALGGTFYRVLSGKHTHEGGSVHEILGKQVRENPVDIKDLVPDIPEKLAVVIHTMLAKDPDDRYDSFEDVVHAIEKSTSSGFSFDLDELKNNKKLLIGVGAGALVVAILFISILASIFGGGNQNSGNNSPQPGNGGNMVAHPGSMIQRPGGGQNQIPDNGAVTNQNQNDENLTEVETQDPVVPQVVPGAQEDPAAALEREAFQAYSTIREQAKELDETSLALWKGWMDKYAGTRNWVGRVQREIERIEAALALYERCENELRQTLATADAALLQKQYVTAMVPIDAYYKKYEPEAKEDQPRIVAALKSAVDKFNEIKAVAKVEFDQKMAQAESIVEDAVEKLEVSKLADAKTIYDDIIARFGLAEFTGPAEQARRALQGHELLISRTLRRRTEEQAMKDQESLDRVLEETAAPIAVYNFDLASQVASERLREMQTPEFRQKLDNYYNDLTAAAMFCGRVKQAVNEGEGVSFDTTNQLFGGTANSPQEATAIRIEDAGILARKGRTSASLRWNVLDPKDYYSLATSALGLARSTSYVDHYALGVIMFELEDFELAERCYRKAFDTASSGVQRSVARENIALSLIFGARKLLDEGKGQEADAKLRDLRANFSDTKAFEDAQ
ncbi:MAG: protein kinase [Planctomycetes bacterium]|nr:protein kinase [Planctomycetota bacterium]